MQQVEIKPGQVWISHDKGLVILIKSVGEECVGYKYIKNYDPWEVGHEYRQGEGWSIQNIHRGFKLSKQSILKNILDKTA